MSLHDFENWEILFYDNSPSNALSDLEDFGHYRHDASNRGFSFANNQMVLSAKYGNIALINPDVFGFDYDFWISLMSRALGRYEIRFVKLLNEDGSHQDCVGEVVSLGRFWRGTRDYSRIETETPVDMGIMAFMLTSREAFARVGLLDCDYLLYAEDMDWCHRAGKAGVPIIYDPTLILTHIGGSSASDRWSQSQALRRKYAAERVFIDKHLRGWRRLAMHLINRMKVILRVRGH